VDKRHSNHSTPGSGFKKSSLSDIGDKAGASASAWIATARGRERQFIFEEVFVSTLQVVSETISTQGLDRRPSPDKFFETMVAYQRTAALKAAIDLDLFTAIGEGQRTASALAKRVHGVERAVRMLCDSLVVLGFLTKGGSEYGLSADSAVFLDRNSPAYAGSARNFLASSFVVDGFRDLAAVVRSGRPVSNQPFSEEDKHAAWAEFARNMAGLSYLVARETAKLLDQDSAIKVLDVAAGHGMFGIAIAQENPRATIVALDWPSVLAVAEENARRFGVSEEYCLLAGDALEADLGTGFDAVVMPNVMHLWDRPTNVRFLKKVHAALVPRGRVVIVEFVPNDDRVSPPVPALFALNMLANTTAGDVYTVSEHQAMLSEAGFPDCQIHQLPPTQHTAIIAIKR
jgi:ubiquinone/menaquinone biosynthesis C-methylase UbiE